MKSERQAEILKIIQAGDVETQEQLLLELEERGFRAAAMNAVIAAYERTKELG